MDEEKIRCRLCGSKADSLKSLFDRTNIELLNRFRTTISILVYEDDELPQHICSNCETTVATFYEKIQSFRLLENGWLDEVRQKTPDHSCLEIRAKLDEQNEGTRARLARLLPELNLDSSASINTSLFYRAEIQQEQSVDEDVDLPKKVETLLQLCVDYINKNGKTMFAEVLKKEGAAKPMKKKNKKNRDYIKRITKKKKRPVMKTEPEDTYELSTSSQSQDESLKPKSTRNSVKAAPANGAVNVDAKPQIKKEMPEEPDDVWCTRPRRKVAIPFYYSDQASTPSPEMFVKNESAQTKANAKSPPSKAGKAKPKTRASDSHVIVTPPATNGIKRKLNASLPPAKKGRFNTDNIPANAAKAKATKSVAAANAPRLEDFIEYTTEKNARTKTRINYSEDLVDEALMYEEMLLNKRQKVQEATLEKCQAKGTQRLMDGFLIKNRASAATFVSKTTLAPQITTIIPKMKIKTEPIPVVGSEITLLPIVKAENIASNAGHARVNLTLDKIKKTLSTNPARVFNINSSVSIQLKSAAQQQVACPSPGLTIKNIHSLFDGSDDSLHKTIECEYCTESFGSNKLLAMHQLIHMRVMTHKLGQLQILESKHRKGRMVNLGNEKVIRCLNCWKLYPNSKSILEHWVHGRCLFYCSICGKSFHDNIKSIRDHFPNAHGIKYRIPERPVKVGMTDLNNQNGPASPPIRKIGVEDLKTQGGKKPQKKTVKDQKKKLPSSVCPICMQKFASLHGRNSHMRCHKDEAGKSPKANANSLPKRVHSPAMSAGSTSSNDSKKRPPPDFRAPKQPVSKKSTSAKHVAAPPTSKRSAVAKSVANAPAPKNPSTIKTSPVAKKATASKRTATPPVAKKVDAQRMPPNAYRKPAASTSTSFQSPAANAPVKNEHIAQPCFVDISDIIANDMQSEQYVDHGYPPANTDGDAPRLQVKSLYELQDPAHEPIKGAVGMEPHMSVCEPYIYGQQNCYAPMAPEPMHNYMNHPNAMSYPPPPPPVSSSGPPHMMQPMAPPAQSPSQLQVPHAQQVQSTQYYNPVFVVQQPQHGVIVNLPSDPNPYQQPQQAYGGPGDYGHYYT